MNFERNGLAADPDAVLRPDDGRAPERVVAPLDLLVLVRNLKPQRKPRLVVDCGRNHLAAANVRL